MFSGDLIEYHSACYCGDAHLREWPMTLNEIRAFNPKAIAPGRGDALMDRIGDARALERLGEVGDQVVGVLDADREAQQVGRHRRARPLDRGAVLDQALDAAERLGKPEDPRASDELDGSLLRLREEGDHAAEVAHLALRDLVAGVPR